MRSLSKLSTSLLAAVSVAAFPRTPPHPHEQCQHPLARTSAPAKQLGVGHFSEWSRETKKEFLIDWQAGKESEWTIVQGNSAGDLDSLTAALAWAYHLEHSTENTSKPIKAIALLQTATHALDLRPENQLALANSKMTEGHEDLLTMDELPEDPETLGPKLKGIVLVDHASPLRKWNKAKILSIFDHHEDQGRALLASPRVFEKVASCTTLVARQMLDELEKLPKEYHMPHELLELILSAIAIDSKGLTKDITTIEDIATSMRILERSNWRKKDLVDVMEDLSDELRDAKKDLDHLGLRDLLRRDWKGDFVDTPSNRTPTVSLGFASIPYSMNDQITKTEFAELFHWFAIHAAWTAEVGVDISVVLNKYKIKDEKGKKKKLREVALVVRDDVRIDQSQADELFALVKHKLESNEELKLKPWERASELAPRQMVWVHESGAGRKIIRPIVEDAITGWA